MDIELAKQEFTNFANLYLSKEDKKSSDYKNSLRKYNHSFRVMNLSGKIAQSLELPKEEIESRAIEALRLVGLDEGIYSQSPFELSGGQKRRVAIAGVISMKPKILILDEPTAGLDPAGRKEILGLVSDLCRKQKMTIILVSHSMDDVAEYADRILVINDGKLAIDATPREVFNHKEELESFGLSLPQVTKAMVRLKESGIPVNTAAITVDEALNEILRVIN